ncbi:hypothetical protein ACH4GK_19215 [Streptomyces rimosus]|uniref:hypothetical protein n=1 Tax=Streptomyces rimosus TaxID=1927 RepID=UPI0004CC54CA|nr:hypothetical protein [Streptomyces rimosus]
MSGKQFGPYDPHDPQGPHYRQDPHVSHEENDPRRSQKADDADDPRAARDPQGPDGDGSGIGSGAGSGVGEDELRRLLRSAVDDLEPAPDALDHLRRAVPARRRRRRHAVVGAAAALLLGGTSIPAMVHVVSFTDGPEDRPANAASTQRTPGGTTGSHGEGTERTDKPPTGNGGKKTEEGTKTAEPGKGPDKNGKQPGTGAGTTPDPSATMDVTSPACSRAQLGNGVSHVGPADSAGRVYGAFRVVNTSDTTCSVEGGGQVGVLAQGSTNSSRISVVDHTAGDAAPGLPDPITTPDQLVLKPGQAYEVKFAWVPAEGGGVTGCAAPPPSPSPGPSKAPGETSPGASAAATDGGSGGGGGTTGGGQAGGDDGTPGGGSKPPGGVVLNHTPEAGEPAAADAKIPDACAGTVYRTEALPAK